jgi:hypothetical protein
LAIGFMLFTAWSILATSKSTYDFLYGTYTLTSDCVQPTLEMRVTTSAGQISDPPATSFTDFGFPNATVTLGSDVNGTVGGRARTCTMTYGDPSGTSNFIYSCFDDGTFACTILIH